MMKTGLHLFCLLALVALAGCRKDPLSHLADDEQRIYITNHDGAATFTAYRTFSVSDRVVVVEDGSSRQQATPADQALMQAISRGLQSRGFRPAASGAGRDLGVQISRIVRTTTGFVSAPDYWRFWNAGFWGMGAWDPAFGWGPGWAVVPYEVREGMLAIDIIDLKNNNNQLRVLWNALVRGTGLTDASAADAIVNSLLQQSPYLQTN